MAAQAAESLLAANYARVYLLEGHTLVSIDKDATEFSKHGDTRSGIVGRVLQSLEFHMVKDTGAFSSFFSP